MGDSLSTIYKRSGISGLIGYINKKSGSNFFWRLIFKFDERFFFFQSMLKHLCKIERGIKHFGPSVQAKRFLKKLRIEVSTYTHISNKNFHRQKGVLIYGVNHSAILEPIILFSLLKAKTNVKLILYHLFYHMGDGVKKYSLPVCPQKFASDNPFGVGFFKSLFDPLYKLRNFERLTRNEIIKMNEKSIKTAINTLERGGVVLIFPTSEYFKEWGRGIARIIFGLDKEKRKKITIIPVLFSGMGRKRMLLRIYKAYKNLKQPNLKVKVYFGKEKKAQEIFNLLKSERLNEQKLVDYLKKDSLTQFNLKDFPFKNYFYPQNLPLAMAKLSLLMTRIVMGVLSFPFGKN